MPYNLPPPWDPGFALPSNAKDEGIQRRAFVTKQMPNGTYDMPNVGTGGYAVPNYVMKEGYGQGAMITKWLPPGTITQPQVPHYLNNRPQVAAEVKLPGGGRKIAIVRKVGVPTMQAVSDFTLDAATVVPLAAAAGLAYLLLRKKR